MTEQITHLSQMRAVLLKPDFIRYRTTGPWSLSQILQHCEQGLSYTLNGFPKMKPKWIRATIGKLVSGKFLRKLEMSHNLTAVVPGAPELSSTKPVEVARDELVASIDRFLAHNGSIHPHFIFGDLDKKSFDVMHAIHFADHYKSLDRSLAQSK